MNLSSYINLRWLLFFLLYFVVWYGVSMLLIAQYQATENITFLEASSAFGPVWLIMTSYLYFRTERDDWNARFVTSIGWVGLMFVFSALLAGPIYGQNWTDAFQWPVMFSHWVSLVAVLIGGTIAHHTTPPKEVNLLQTENAA